MRCVGSSPAAALQALKSRARNGETTVDRNELFDGANEKSGQNDVEPSTISETRLWRHTHTLQRKKIWPFFAIASPCWLSGSQSRESDWVGRILVADGLQ